MRRAASLTAFALACCAPAERIDLVLPPPDSDARTVVVALERVEGEVLEVVDASVIDVAALGRESGAPHLPALTDYDDTALVRITALYYKKTIDDLALFPGRLREPVVGESARLLPAPATTRLRSIGGGLDSGWTAGEPSAAVMRTPFPSPFACKESHPENVTLSESLGPMGTPVDTVWLLPLTDREALVATATGALYMLRRGAAPIAIAPPPGLPLSAATRAPDGAVYFGGATGEIWRAREIRVLPSSVAIEGAEPIATSPSRQAIRWIAAGEGGREIFTLSFLEGTLELFDGSLWREIAVLGAAPLPELSGVVRAAPAHAIAIRGSSGEVLRYRNGETTFESLPDDVGSATAIAFVTGFGVLIGTNTGVVLHDAGDRWAVLGGSGLSAGIGAIQEDGDGGFLVAGPYGHTSRYQQGRFCPKQLGGLDVLHIARIGDALVLGGDPPDTGRQTFVTVLVLDP